MTTEQRLTNLETEVSGIKECLEALVANAVVHTQLHERVEQQIVRLDEVLARQVDLLRLVGGYMERQQESQDKQDKQLAIMVELLEEVRRDSAHTQKIWVRLAQHYGWMEDTDWTETAD